MNLNEIIVYIASYEDLHIFVFEIARYIGIIGNWSG